MSVQRRHQGGHYNDRPCTTYGNPLNVSDIRLALLSDWVRRDLGLAIERIEVASADASFRRYFRIIRQGNSPLVAMDAPPEHEDVGPYLHVSGLLSSIGVHVPAIHEVDRTQGFLLMEDLGSTPYLSQLQRREQAPALYGDALAALRCMQVDGGHLTAELAPYDEAVLQREMALLPDWFLARHLQIELTSEEQEALDAARALLVAESLAQPTVFVHRDYHSRNLMVLPERGPGVIDFQDALAGPIGYDLVSLLKDCYISWSRAEIEHWLRDYRQSLIAAQRADLAGSDEREFIRWFDMIGLQRHIKILGIFARLWWRDGKAGYLNDLPLTLHYVIDACARYPELHALGRWFESRIAPLLPAANARARAR